MSTMRKVLKDRTTKLGLLLLIISLITFLITSSQDFSDSDTVVALFIFHFALTWIYLFVVAYSGKKDSGRLYRFPNITHNVILLQSFNVSAYSLNRTIPVFYSSTDWLAAFLFISNGLLLFHVLSKNYRVSWWNHLILGISTLGLFFQCYQSIYVGPIYPYGLLGFWVFGISLHVFVPLLYVWTFIKVIRGYLAATNKYYKTMVLTTAFLLLFVAYFSIQYHEVNKVVNNYFHQTNLPFEDKSLPAWVKTSQQLSPNWITERALKAGIVYRSFNKYRSGFKEQGTSFQYSGRYKSDWHLSFDAPILASSPFYFNDKSFHLEELKKIYQPFKPDNYFLDINSGWTNSEFLAIWELIKTKNVFAYVNGRMEPLTVANKNKIFKQMKQQNYTLFPFYRMTHASEALVISKFSALTPTLNDFKASEFNTQLSQFFQDHPSPIKVFNIGEAVSPYLQHLKELRTIQLENGGLHEIEKSLSENNFIENQENENVIVNNYAGFKLIETEQVKPQNTHSQAPDHLMRLFAYNNLLKAIGENYVNKKELAKELIEEAKEANVVSPISSLIVLETQADYDRFDIKKSKNSLDNASIINSGAVPEPHEWLLILMVLCWLTYIYRKTLFLKWQR